MNFNKKHILSFIAILVLLVISLHLGFVLTDIFTSIKAQIPAFELNSGYSDHETFVKKLKEFIDILGLEKFQAFQYKKNTNIQIIL